MQTTTRCYRKTKQKNQTKPKICIQKLFLPALLFSLCVKQLQQRLQQEVSPLIYPQSAFQLYDLVQ